MKKTILLVFAFLTIVSCNNKSQSEDVAEEKSEVNNKPITDLSIYNLPEKWTNQDGKNIELKELRGKVLVMVMIYTSCKAACPRLVADMRNIEERIPNIISVFNAEGEMTFQQEGLGVSYDKTVAKIKEEASKI